jgi:hypothetical protein
MMVVSAKGNDHDDNVKLKRSKKGRNSGVCLLFWENICDSQLF